MVGLAITALIIGRFRRGHRGLDQWQMPYGRYYKRWLKLPEAAGGDYYEWLAHEMGNREPWKTWAAMEKHLPRSQMRRV
jgi:hypothetical protein